MNAVTGVVYQGKKYVSEDELIKFLTFLSDDVEIALNVRNFLKELISQMKQHSN